MTFSSALWRTLVVHLPCHCVSLSPTPLWPPGQGSQTPDVNGKPHCSLPQKAQKRSQRKFLFLVPNCETNVKLKSGRVGAGGWGLGWGTRWSHHETCITSDTTRVRYIPLASCLFTIERMQQYSKYVIHS